MSDKIKVAAFLPAKGSSERIPSKNTRLFFGKPLFLYTLEKLVACDFIDEVYLDSEDEEILSYADYLDYRPLRRDAALATNKTDGHRMFYNEVRQVEADIYIQILCTSPFIKPETIKKGIDILKNDSTYDSVVLVKRDKQYLWENHQPIYDKHNIPNSKDLPDTVIESMGLYIVRAKTALEEKKRYGNKAYLLDADPMEALDINTAADIELAEHVMAGRCLRERQALGMLSRFFNSSLLSDLADELGFKAAITGLGLNMADAKIFGRANTLALRALKPGEDYRGIYDALHTYEKIVPGDIIVVDNQTPHRAYFGELNANLAIRSGAVGTIVNGVTRDIREVTALGYPVLSRGYCCADVKGVATMQSHNKPVEIDGVTIFPGDLIFADINGVVVIPRKREQELLSRAIQVAGKEKNILNRVLENTDAFSIYKSEGEF